MMMLLKLVSIKLFKIEGVFKNPNFKPWSSVDPNKEVKLLWEALEKDNKEKGIEEIGEGSTCFEHHFEFWGTWKIMKPGITVEFSQNPENWPKGIKNIEESLLSVPSFLPAPAYLGGSFILTLM